MAPVIRIFLRYLSGVLLAKGFVGQDDMALFDDPDLTATIELGTGILLSAATEYWYKLASRFGWDK